MKLVMNRDVTISGMSGHVLRFKKDVPQHVPPAMVEEVMGRGGIPEGNNTAGLGNAVEASPDLRPKEQRICEAIERISLNRAREDFSAGGRPTLKAIERESGFKVTSEERDAAWVKVFGAQPGV